MSTNTVSGSIRLFQIGIVIGRNARRGVVIPPDQRGGTLPARVNVTLRQYAFSTFANQFSQRDASLCRQTFQRMGLVVAQLNLGANHLPNPFTA